MSSYFIHLLWLQCHYLQMPCTFTRMRQNDPCTRWKAPAHMKKRTQGVFFSPHSAAPGECKHFTTTKQSSWVTIHALSLDNSKHTRCLKDKDGRQANRKSSARAANNMMDEFQKAGFCMPGYTNRFDTDQVKHFGWDGLRQHVVWCLHLLARWHTNTDLTLKSEKGNKVTYNETTCGCTDFDWPWRDCTPITNCIHSISVSTTCMARLGT